MHCHCQHDYARSYRYYYPIIPVTIAMIAMMIAMILLGAARPSRDLLRGRRQARFLQMIHTNDSYK